MPVFSVNAWSLERMLGPLRMIEWRTDTREHALKVDDRPETMTLMELAAELGSRGYRAVEIPYSQFQDTSDEALDTLRSAAREAGFEMASLLLDYGDLSSSDPLRVAADSAWYMRWIDIAAKAGFRCVRIPAGESDPQERSALQRSAEGLTRAALHAEPLGLRVVTENLGSLLSNADNCLRLLEMCREKVGFTADFGNFKTDKYRQLAEVLPLAETVHAKAATVGSGGYDAEDFRRCLGLCADAGFKGPYSLTYLGDSNDVWKLLGLMRADAEDVLRKQMPSGIHMSGR